MTVFNDLGDGFLVAFQIGNLLAVLVGVVIGTVIGVLPGLGPTATIALLLPITYSMDPTASIIMLAGIYYGSMYGGTITSVLLRIPGEAASVVTTLDGYEMTKQGRAGAALGISAVGSFIGGTAAVIGLTFLAPVAAQIAIMVGPPGYVALMVAGLILVATIGNGSKIKNISMAGLGLFLATIGPDPITGTPRFTFGNTSLIDGLDFVVVAMGLFGVGELLHTLEKSERGQLLVSKVKGIWPSRDDFKKSAGPIARGSVLGFFIGLLPGGGGVMSSLLSYSLEKRRAKDPSRFGNGAIEGVAGPETANNASSTSAFVPLLTLGVPSNVVLAMMFGALMLHGITPGPDLITEHPNVFWGVIASMYVGNAILLALNIPLVGIFVQLLRVKSSYLVTIAMVIVIVGAYSLSNNVFDIFLVIIFGVIGWLMMKTGFDPAPLVLAFVLGKILETSFRQSMLISQGSLDIFLRDPVSLVVALALFAFVTLSVFKAVRVSKNRGETDSLQSEDDRASKADSAQ